MQTKQHLFDDLSRLAGSGMRLTNAVREQISRQIKDGFDHALRNMDLVTREEFEVTQKMLQKARITQEAFEKRITLLEEQLATKPKAKASASKESTAKASSPKASSSSKK